MRYLVNDRCFLHVEDVAGYILGDMGDELMSKVYQAYLEGKRGKVQTFESAFLSSYILESDDPAVFHDGFNAMKDLMYRVIFNTCENLSVYERRCCIDYIVVALPDEYLLRKKTAAK